jgi:hypothetical protein
MTTVFDWAAKHGLSQAALTELFGIIDPGHPVGVPGPEASESAVQANLQLEAARRGGSLWRNNSGACVDQDGRMVRYGLANTSSKINEVFKSSDLIGITPMQIGGQIVGVFTAIEVKAPGFKGPRSDREKAQNAFLTKVRALGGIGLFAQSVKDVFK